MIKVKAVQDDNGHWFVIPNNKYEEFIQDLNNEDMVYKFEYKWGKWRTGGDLNLVQLYAEL